MHLCWVHLPAVHLHVATQGEIFFPALTRLSWQLSFAGVPPRSKIRCSCTGRVQLCRRCTAALEVYGCAEVYGCVSILAVQRRRRGRGELFHKSLVIKLVNKIQKSFPMYHSSLVHGLLKLKDKIILKKKKQLERALGSIQRHSYTCSF